MAAAHGPRPLLGSPEEEIGGSPLPRPRRSVAGSTASPHRSSRSKPAFRYSRTSSAPTRSFGRPITRIQTASSRAPRYGARAAEGYLGRDPVGVLAGGAMGFYGLN